MHCLQVRLIVNTGVAVLESVTSLNNLFYHTLPGRGEYANLMLKEDNVDFHLLIDQVASAKLVTGKSSRGESLHIWFASWTTTNLLPWACLLCGSPELMVNTTMAKWMHFNSCLISSALKSHFPRTNQRPQRRAERFYWTMEHGLDPLNLTTEKLNLEASVCSI